MTVGELRDLLKDEPDTMQVWAEGCDCQNPIDGVERQSHRVWGPGEPFARTYLPDEEPILVLTVRIA